MAYVQVPKDLTKVKTKVMLNLTKRQLICFSIAGAIGIPTYLGTRTFAGNTVAVFLMIGLMLPFFFFAMYEKDGQSAEKIFRNFLRVKLWSGIRPYKTENLYKYLSEQEGKIIAGKAKTTGAAASRKHLASEAE